MSNLSPYRPSDLFADLRREMDDAFSPWFGRGRALSGGAPEVYFAPLDVHESDKEYTVRVDAPGMSEKDFKITCNGNVLTVSGERRAEKTETRGKAHYSERSYGSFSRSMTLPIDVAHDGIRAKYAQGVLEVVVPKQPGGRQREIKVET